MLPALAATPDCSSPTPCPQVAALEAEREALYAENQGLNKQQAALSSEVRQRVGGGGWEPVRSVAAGRAAAWC